MAYTHHELKGKTVAELRDIAQGVKHDAVQGYSQMNKEHLIGSLCKALNIPIHEHHEVVGINKPVLKARIRELKTERDAALAAGDNDRLHAVREHIHGLNRQIRKHTV